MTGGGETTNVSDITDACPCPRAEVYDYSRRLAAFVPARDEAGDRCFGRDPAKVRAGRHHPVRPAVVRGNWDGSKHYWRFNPPRFVRYLESKGVPTWGGERQGRQSAGAAGNGGPGGPTGTEGRSVRPSSTGADQLIDIVRTDEVRSYRQWLRDGCQELIP